MFNIALSLYPSLRKLWHVLCVHTWEMTELISHNYMYVHKLHCKKC